MMINREIKQLIARKQRLLKSDSRDEYSRVGNEVGKQITARRKFFNRRTLSTKNPKYWKVINDLRNPKTCSIDDRVLASELNNGFHSVWGGMFQPDISEFTTRFVAPTADAHIFSTCLVEIALKNINSSSPGPDGIAGRLLKSARLELSVVLSFLFNCFLIAVFVPVQWPISRRLPKSTTQLSREDLGQIHNQSDGGYLAKQKSVRLPSRQVYHGRLHQGALRLGKIARLNHNGNGNLLRLSQSLRPRPARLPAAQT